MAFISVPEERFKTDILKTRLSFFKNDSELAGVSVLTRLPDVDVGLKLPNIVIARVGNENRELARLSGYHADSQRTELDSPSGMGQLKGYTMLAMYQINIMTKTIGEMNKIASIIERKLKSADKSDLFAEDWIGLPQTTVIPILDFADATDPTGSPTDLAIRFRPQRDVECLEIPAFDTELHQYVISVSFRVHYLKEYEFPKIESIVTEVTVED